MQLLTEKFKSNILAKIAPQHGGIAMWINGGKREGPKVWYRDKKVDLSTITDDMLIGEPFVYDDVYTNGRVNGKLTPEAYEKVSNVVLFNDGYAIQLKPYRLHKQDGTEEPHDPKEKPSKYGTGIGDTGDHVHYDSDGDSKKQTQFYDPYAISPDAGYGNSLRNAYKNNKGERDELQAQLNQLDNNAENTFQRNALKKRIKNAESDMEDNKKNAAQTVKNHDRASQVKPIALNESDVLYIVTESARRILNELELNNGDMEYPEYNKGWSSNCLTPEEDDRLTDYYERLDRGEQLTKDEEIDFTWLQAKESPYYRRRDELFKYDSLKDSFAGQKGYFDDGDLYPSTDYVNGRNFRN